MDGLGSMVVMEVVVGCGSMNGLSERVVVGGSCR